MAPEAPAETTRVWSRKDAADPQTPEIRKSVRYRADPISASRKLETLRRAYMLKRKWMTPIWTKTQVRSLHQSPEATSLESSAPARTSASNPGERSAAPPEDRTWRRKSTPMTAVRTAVTGETPGRMSPKTL